MGWLKYILTGGFLAGYRTIILAIAVFVQALAGYFVGDVGFFDLVQKHLVELLLAFGLLTAAVHKS